MSSVRARVWRFTVEKGMAGAEAVHARTGQIESRWVDKHAKLRVDRLILVDNSFTRSFTSSRTTAAVRPELAGAWGAGSAPVFRVRAVGVPPVVPDRTPRPRRY